MSERGVGFLLVLGGIGLVIVAVIDIRSASTTVPVATMWVVGVIGVLVILAGLRYAVRRK